VDHTTFPALLAAELRRDPSRPVVTFYDDATGERIELSTTTYANWVAKTAGLVQDELDLERGSRVHLALPSHWLGAVWVGAVLTLGGTVVTGAPATAEDVDLVVCGPEGLPRFAPLADRVPVLALSLAPLGARFREPLPTGVVDYGAVVLGQPDVFMALDPTTADDVVWRDADGELRGDQVAVLGSPVAGGERLITDLNPVSRAGLAALVGPLRAGAGTVWVRHGDPDTWARHRDSERATAELRAG
jgi:uncharacterized protein (TIGR03089 family)